LKVLVADDHEFVRGGLVSELSDILPDAVFLEAGDATEALKILKTNTDVTLAILDLYMPGANKYELIEIACKEHPKLLVVVLTASEDSRDLRALIDRGVSAYIPKTLGKDIVNHAIRLVLAGDTYFPGYMLVEAENEQLVDPQKLELKITSLTKRQKAVLKLLLNGSANKSIARQLDVAENTVKIHVTAIFKTLGLTSRAQVIASVNEAEIKYF